MSTTTHKGAVGAETKTAEDIDRAIVAALAGINIVEAAEEYEFYADEGSHTPTDLERCLLIDFAHGLMSDIHKAVRPLVAATSAPDSLRAMSEDTSEFATMQDLQIREGDDGATVMRKFRASLAYAKAAAAAAGTHPAGQSAGSGGSVRQPIATAPLNEEVYVYCGEMRFRAKLVPDASVYEDDNGRERICDQWQATRDGEHPPCWSEGGCWASNADESPSLQPTHWSPAPTPTASE